LLSDATRTWPVSRIGAEVMHTRKTRWTQPMRAAILLVAALAATLLTPGGVANASTREAVMPAGLTPDGLRSELLEDFKVGDCWALAGAHILLHHPDADGISYLTWAQEGYSEDPSSGGDIWHGTFTFQDAAGTTLLIIGALDGIPMKIRGRIYFWQTPSAQPVTDDILSAVTQVRWRGFC
jgi:hypothetical protein